MSCCNSKDCDCHQNSSFIFGLIIGLVIAAVVAIVVYKNDRQDVFIKLKKQLEKFFASFKKTETFQNISTLANKVNINNSAKISKKSKKIKVAPAKPFTRKTPKITVTLPPELIKKEFEKKIETPKSKPRIFKK
jgi:gas vesicle protein